MATGLGKQAYFVLSSHTWSDTCVALTNGTQYTCLQYVTLSTPTVCKSPWEESDAIRVFFGF